MEDVFNAILIKGKTTGDVMFYGRGAGKLPTASAVVADIVDCTLNLDRNIGYYWPSDKLEVVPVENSVIKCLVRLSYENRAELLSKAKEVFGDFDLIDLDVEDGELGIVTGYFTEKEMDQKIAVFDGALKGMIRIQE